MQNKKNNMTLIKATIIDIIVAFLITLLLITSIDLFLGQKIDLVVGLLNTVAMSYENEEVDEKVETVLDNENKTLKNYPNYGEKYAQIKIEKIDVDLPVYFGNTLEILKKGVGHDNGSYFPGEGGSIIYMGHNSKSVFRRFSELKLGDKIEVTKDYGKFTYKTYDMKLIKETDVDMLPIQKEKEILMIYTCYPFNNIGYTTQRYVVYSELIDQE